MVLIGVDPHKGSHTAVVVDRDEHEVAQLIDRRAAPLPCHPAHQT